MKDFKGDLNQLKRPQGDRAELEAEARARVDGRTLRRKGRDQPTLLRLTPAKRQQLERLAQANGWTFVETVERALEVLEAELVGKR